MSDDDIGSPLVAQRVDLLERADAIHHAIEMVEVVSVRFGVVDRLAVGEAQGDIADAAVAERGVRLLDGVGDQIRLDVDVVGGSLLRVEHHDVDGGLLGGQLLALRQGDRRDRRREAADVRCRSGRVGDLTVLHRARPPMQQCRYAPRNERLFVLLRRLRIHGLVLGRDSLRVELGNRTDLAIGARGFVERVGAAAVREHAAGPPILPAHEKSWLARLHRLAAPGGAAVAGGDAGEPDGDTLLVVEVDDDPRREPTIDEVRGDGSGGKGGGDN